MNDDLLAAELGRQRRERDAQTEREAHLARQRATEDEAADEAILSLCRSFADQMPFSAARPFVVGETKQVAVQREAPGFLRKRTRTEYESRIVEREIAQGWRVLTAEGGSFEWVIQAESGRWPEVKASRAINFCVSTDGEPMQVLVSGSGAFAGSHPLIDSELKRQAALRLLEVRLGPAPRPLSRWLRERFDLAPEKGHSQEVRPNRYAAWTTWIKHDVPAHGVAAELAPHLARIVLEHTE